MPLSRDLRSHEKRDRLSGCNMRQMSTSDKSLLNKFLLILRGGLEACGEFVGRNAIFSELFARTVLPGTIWEGSLPHRLTLIRTDHEDRFWRAARVRSFPSWPYRENIEPSAWARLEANPQAPIAQGSTNLENPRDPESRLQ